jgi:hypothetical protein
MNWLLRKPFHPVARRLFGKHCPVCGKKSLTEKGHRLWEELIQEWELSPAWADWFSRRESEGCSCCGIRARSQSLAKALVRYAGATRSLIELTAQPSFQRLAVAEMGLDYTFYSFRGDFAALKAKAKAELTKKGFEDAFNTFPSASAAKDMAYFTKGNMMSAVAASTTGTAKPPKMPDIAMVMIYKDTRITPKAFKANYRPGKDIGWVSVAVMGRREKTPFDTLREWIGL